jgi:hypothetical protein
MPTKPKYIKEIHAAYRREEGGPIFVRDSYGRYNCFLILGNDEVKALPARENTVGPEYDRVDHKNGTRFTGKVRSANDLLSRYNAAGSNLKKTGWVRLPKDKRNDRRTTTRE